jgi:type II secretion system protein H
MRLSTPNAQRPTLNVQSTRFGRSTLAFRAFTLIELILVMVLITIVMSVALPSLKGFFKGRDLDSEARRFLSLTRYAASRAVAEGVPMELFVDIEQKRYGLRAQAGFLETDSKSVQYALPEDLSFEVTAPPSKTAAGEDNLGDVNTDPATITTTNPIKIARFYPDGFIGDKSPAAIILRQRPVNDSVEGEAVAIAQSATRLNYEIRTLQPSR